MMETQLGCVIHYACAAVAILIPWKKRPDYFIAGIQFAPIA
jgi:hypothetical protein